MCVNESCLLTLTPGYNLNKWRKPCVLWKEGSLSHRAWDAHQVWFIKAFSSQRICQNWLANVTADLHLHPFANLLDCTGLFWLLPCASRQWLHLPIYHSSFVATCKGSELGLTLPGARNNFHSKEFLWSWGNCMVKTTRNSLFLPFLPHYSFQPSKWYDSRQGALPNNCRVQNCITGYGNQV